MSWILLGLFLLFVVLWGWYSSNLVITMERSPLSVIPAAFGLAYEETTFPAPDGVVLKGWFVPAAKPSDTTIVLCHGWGADRANLLPSTVFLNQRGGYNLCYFDFRNHGESGGTRSSLGPLEIGDMEAALDYITRAKPEQTRRLGVYGLSMGAAVALTVTARDPRIEAVVAESAFSSFNGVVARFARIFYGVPRLPFVPMTLFFVRARLGIDPELSSPVRFIDRIAPRPVFLIQGDKDERMPPSEGAALFSRAKEPKTLWTIPGADHGEAAEVAGKEYQDRLLQFYDGVFRKQTSLSR